MKGKLPCCVWLFATLWTPLSMEFSRQVYWSRLPFPSPGDLPHSGTEARSPALAGEFFSIWATREARAFSYLLLIYPKVLRAGLCPMGGLCNSALWETGVRETRNRPDASEKTRLLQKMIKKAWSRRTLFRSQTFFFPWNLLIYKNGTSQHTVPWLLKTISLDGI